MTAPWVAVEAQRLANPNPMTVNLPAAYDDRHILVAAVTFWRNTANPVTHSWPDATLVWEAYIGQLQHHIYAIRADSETAGITLNWGLAPLYAHVTLYALYGTDPAPTAVTADATTQATAVTTTIAPVTIPTAPTIALAFVGLQNFVGSIQDVPGWVPPPSIPGQPLHIIAVTALAEPGQTPATTAGWNTTRTYRRVIAAWHASLPPEPEQPATRYYLGDQPLHRRLGDHPIG